MWYRGTCAAAVAAVLERTLPKTRKYFLVHLRGGDLTIRYTDETVWMTGPGVTVCEGYGGSMITTLFFDLDGTLTDSQEGITKSVAHALRTVCGMA